MTHRPHCTIHLLCPMCGPMCALVTLYRAGRPPVPLRAVCLRCGGVYRVRRAKAGRDGPA